MMRRDKTARVISAAWAGGAGESEEGALGSTTQPAVLEAENITKTFYDGDVETKVLKGVNLSLKRGDLVALMGPSGSGKSTLLHILGTLLRPTAGDLVINGRRINGLSDREVTGFRSRTLGFVFQFHHLLPDFTALENVLFPSFPIFGHDTPDTRARALHLLEQVGLSHRARFLATRISGGEKQRVAIARALMNQPAVVLADEPTGNVDRQNSHQIMSLLREIRDVESTAFIISTHDEEVASACDHIIRITDGVIG